MSRTGKILLFVTAMTFAAMPLCAQDGSGGTRSIFTVGAGSRAIGMGGAFVALGDADEHGITDVDHCAFQDLPEHYGRGVNAVLSVGETLESILKKLPEQIERVQTLLVGPDAYPRQIGTESTDTTPV